MLHSKELCNGDVQIIEEGSAALNFKGQGLYLTLVFGLFGF
jgi:hypothetical protein